MSRQKLEDLAQRFGIELSYYDIKGRHMVASDQALYAVLCHLGAELLGPSELDSALVAEARRRVDRPMEPVLVAWDGLLHDVSLVVPAARKDERYVGALTLESGEVLPFAGRLEDAGLVESFDVAGDRHEARRVELTRSLPLGYHRLELETQGRAHSALVIAAPERAYSPTNKRRWGIFAPTYALWREGGTGGGGFADLERLIDAAQRLGAEVVGTLPLMSAFLDEPFEPSPYAPVSRLFWNELFIDLDRLPEAKDDKVVAARNAASFVAEAKALEAMSLVDYRRQMALHRTVLERAAEAAFHEGSAARAELDRFAALNPRAPDYARFRAATEAGSVWHRWSERQKAGELSDRDVDLRRYRYHLYVQLRASQQMARLAGRAKQKGGGLYLDLPLGVHPDGYDAWRQRDSFLGGCSAGAPPDDLFAGGQDWGFRPLHPTKIREESYDYVIACIRHQLGSAGALRIDHVMGLERIFCVPHGLGGEHGIYVHYKSEELYAILTLESHRHRAQLIGEDLGTVPDVVRAAMNRHQLSRMYVAQFSFRHDPNWAIEPPPEAAAASVNTHDTPTFTAFWEGKDIELRLGLGHLAEGDAVNEREGRRWMRQHLITFLQSRQLLAADTSTKNVLAAVLAFLAASDAQLLLINLEDLLGETRAQNVPGTTDQHPNWRHKAKRPTDRLDAIEGLTAQLADLDRRRRR